MQNKKIRVLFFCETVTLAHLVRPIVLAKNLDPELFEIHFAANDRYKNLLTQLPHQIHGLESISGDQFLDALKKGRPVYSSKTLINYVENDLRVIQSVQPDIIIGDFRLSLSISSKLSGKLYINVSNIYWSPYVQTNFVIPENPLVELFGVKIAQKVFDVVRPVIFGLHCIPMNLARKHYGLDSLRYDLKTVYTLADYTVYADIPELFKYNQLPGNHHFIGPVVWSPEVDLPEWWGDIPKGFPVVYVSLGSSGAVHLLPEILFSLAKLPITLIAATAGRMTIADLPENTFVTDFLPGNEACAIADLIICNGGSPSTQQAILNGASIIGISNNLDQYLNMEGYVKAGVGITIRSDRVSEALLSGNVQDILQNEKYSIKTKELQSIFNRYLDNDVLSNILISIDV